MKYVSIDTETTGLDPASCQLLQVAMVVEDTTESDVPIDELPFIDLIAPVYPNKIQGEAYALAMNADLLKIIDNGQSPRIARDKWYFEEMLLEFLDEHFAPDELIVAAGKNFGGFDRLFLPDMVAKRFHHRSIDPGSVFINWNKEYLPSLGELTGEPVTHDALEDARDVIKVLRRAYSR